MGFEKIFVLSREKCWISHAELTFLKMKTFLRYSSACVCIDINAFLHRLSDYYMAFLISHVLSALGSISAQESHGSMADIDRGLIIRAIWKMTCYDRFIICFNNGEKKTDWYILIFLRGSQIEVQRVKSKRTSYIRYDIVLKIICLNREEKQQYDIFWYGRKQIIH